MTKNKGASDGETGRPLKEIDWELVDKLLVAGCYASEIAPHFNMHPDTLIIRVGQKYNMTFSAYASEKRFQGHSILRAKQFEKATKGDNTILIWLGKNQLGQNEAQQNKSVSEDDIRRFNDYMSMIAKAAHSTSVSKEDNNNNNEIKS